MELFDPKSLALVKYEAQQILFVNKNSRQIFRYFDSPPANCPTFSHPHLLTGTSFQQGVLYPKEQSTLLNQIDQRARSSIEHQFSEEQITNTFQPLFECLASMHQSGIAHGSIHPENIVILDDEVKLRDGMAPTLLTSQYYKQGKTKQNDIQALGSCLLNCVLLTAEKPDPSQKQAVLQKCFDRFSRTFLIFLLIVVRGQKKYYPALSTFLQGTAVIDEYLREGYEKIRLEKDKKNKLASQPQVTTPPHFGVIKKFAISNPKKVVHHENIENKADNQSKKSGERSSKAQQKQVTAHQLMTKKMNEQQKRIKQESLRSTMNKTAILNLSNFGLENNSKKLQNDRISPLVKSRNYSKKK